MLWFNYNMDLNYFDSFFLFVVNEECKIRLCRFLRIEEFFFDVFS